MTHAFQNAQFLSAKEKALVLSDWVRFLSGGLRREDFSKRLYDHLHLHCCFIAHYNRDGFYATYFERGEDTARFLSQFDSRGECLSVEYGCILWLTGDCADLSRAMIDEATRHIPRLLELAQAAQREADLAQARALFAKHGVER